MVVVGDTVTVTADKNFYVKKYEIEYKDGGVWKLYQEVDATGKEWDAFSFDFTSDVAKSVTFRLNAYADMYDEEQDGWVVGLIDTSDEFTITWTSNEHVHVYSAIPNGKDETSHWKECTDPACPDKAHSKIEVEAHKDNTADHKCDICGYDLPVPEYIVSYNENGGSGTMVGDVIEKGGTFTLEACTYTAPQGKQFKAWAIGSVNGEQKQPGEQIIITAETYIYAVWEDIPTQHVHNHGTIWVTDENEHWNECVCGDKANKAAHTDSNNDGKCDTCEYQMSTTPNTPDDPSDDKDGLGAGAIVGIVIGSAAVVGICGFALFWFVIRKRR